MKSTMLYRTNNVDEDDDSHNVIAKVRHKFDFTVFEFWNFGECKTITTTLHNYYPLREI